MLLVPGFRLHIIQKRLGKRKLHHDLAGVIGDFENRIQKFGFGRFRLQQLADHGTPDLPGMVGIAQNLAVRVCDKVIAKTRIEEISWHEMSYGRHGGRCNAGSHAASRRKTSRSPEPYELCGGIDVTAGAAALAADTLETKMTSKTPKTWKTPKIVEVQVGMEINMYASATGK